MPLAHAQEIAPATASSAVETAPVAPLEIEADKQLEWLRHKNMYRATGNVVITRGSQSIHSDYAEAHYDPAQGPSALTALAASGNVVMSDQGRVIKADKADYDTRTGLLVLTGKVLTLETADMTVSATKEMTYHSMENKATASGNAEIIQKAQRLKADEVAAFFTKDTQQLERAEAHGSVLITRQSGGETDIAQADHAYYNAVDNLVDLKGRVRLTRGGNHMYGHHGTMNLVTGHSTLKNGSAEGKGRVRAIFSTTGN